MKEESTPPRLRLRHRFPLSLRRHWKLLVSSVVAIVILVVLFGNQQIRPYITSDVDVMTSSITDNVTGTVSLFDDSVEHEIELEIDDVQYSQMIDAYERDGDKDWVTADLTIDGEFINDVAVRLKGNSTLAALSGEGPAAPGGPGGGGEGQRANGQPALPDGFQPPEGMPAMPAMPEGAEMPEGMPEGAAMPEGMPGMDSDVTADDPNTLPLLISFDKYVEGRAYQGMTELAVRPGTPVLNEAVALDLTAATGQTSQRSAYSRYSVNDAPATTRLVLEHPDDGYVTWAFDGSGYLYKADANSRFEFVGEDQSDYSDQFKQVNSSDDGTLQPIINFLRWMDSASDEQFAADLDQWIDVESYAEYLATQNLLSNFDDMAGPGQNYYLWYSLEDEKFTVVSWDLNLAMSGDTAAGPGDSSSMGMPGGDMPMGMPEGEMPEGMPATDGGDMPMGMPPTDGRDQPAEGGAEGRGGPAIGHPLKTRFLESAELTALYEQKYWELYDQMYGSGLAVETLDTILERFPHSEGVNQTTLDDDAASLRDWITERAASLGEQRPD